jgi:RNA polymerase sigma-70 factor (sigma-E family)
VQASDREFADFYDDARHGCLRAVLATVGNRDLAEDLVAEGFARAWASWPKVRRHPAPAAWVVRTALNLRISWWRRRHREVVLTGDNEIAVSEEPELDDRLMAALRRLPVRQREVLALRIFLDLDTESTARALGIAPGTVKSHLSRALAELRRYLAPITTQEGVR